MERNKKGIEQTCTIISSYFRALFHFNHNKKESTLVAVWSLLIFGCVQLR